MTDMTNLDNLDDIDALLDRNLDDIEDLPSFETWVPGVHKCTIQWERKDIKKKVDGVEKEVPHMQLTMVHIETLEVADSKDEGNIPKPGDKMNTAYDLTNEFAMGALKKATKNLAEQFGGNLKATIKGSNGFEVAAVTKRRADKNDKTRFFPQVEDLISL